MKKLEHIERTVEELDPTEFEAFSNWFEALQARRWDGRIEADEKDGKLDRLAAGALSAFRSGKTRPL
ncbi:MULTISPECIES: hypothetical protein [Rhizobium]|uniref:Uncharacterized protein n=1 Tax=Rhizobium rhododendri TaxID=2506430 RepID=A0ABY8IEU5_9HYPH|nr:MULTISPECIES: hypothetical protein [Rhizobium]MBO9099109.1 hypothetical protein [Rhizobium sp. L58/93]MBO9132084.1 hypothetical protein [Rhizobium sp. B209b/85]MBO9169372.1 hypothetical protein [Rhizobium sp. L245/93]MBO9185324.1 hypothetical protein [Rhizobium sp. E27B/91]MBZ5758743.1 hypothetical protein [Rhizobium sp. VS19-DR96]